MLPLTIPIVWPAVKELGINPIVFGVLAVGIIEIGLIPPPIGLNVYVLKGVAPNVNMGTISSCVRVVGVRGIRYRGDSRFISRDYSVSA